MLRTAALVAALLASSLVGRLVYAQVLHEHVDLAAVKCANGVCWHAGRASDGAAAILSDGEVVPAPSGGAQPTDGEPIYSASSIKSPANGEVAEAGPLASFDSAPSRRASVRMDRETGPEPPGKRTYSEPFNPAVFPFKRMNALDSVRANETLAVAPEHEELTALPVLGADQREPGRDAFWGSIVIDFEPQKWVPIPSVAPSSRMLAYRVEPSIGVEFARDGADNYFVRSSAGGRHRLTWLSDALQSYFSGDLPVTRIGDEPRALLTPVPPAVARRAQKVFARLKLQIDRGALLNPVLDALVEHFRSFEPGDAPPSPGSGSTYLDLALAKKGSCRHRSYAFVITALSAGIPARYVENELHVFVEVYVPRVGWRRINLGGAEVEHQVNGTDGKLAYQAKGADPFPEPPPFTHGGDAQPPAPKNLKARSAAARGSGNTNGGASGEGEGAGGAGGRGAGGASVGGGTSRGSAMTGISVGNGGGAGGSGVGEGRASNGRVNLDALEQAAAAGADDHAAATRIGVEVPTRDAFRGDKIEVAGRVVSVDGHAGGLPVEIYLDGADGGLRVGSAVTDGDGRWRAAIEVPRDLAVGDHKVVARTPGDNTRRGASSRGH